MEEVVFLALNPLDVMKMSAGEAVEGPWWHVGSPDLLYVVKARSARQAKDMVTQDSSHDVLFAHLLQE